MEMPASMENNKNHNDDIRFLTAGIAHDLNNLFSGMRGFIDLASQRGCSQEESMGYLEEIRKIILSAQDLVTQLSVLAKGETARREAVSIKTLLDESVAICTVGSKVSVEKGIDDNLWACHVDRSQIYQVFTNILRNAVQAMPEGGTLSVVASNAVPPENDAGPFPPEKSIRIVIRDTGCGIAEDTLPHIFKSFFTTKKGGSGLGLAIAWSIVTMHDGTIMVESVPGKGATFTIMLPVFPDGAEMEKTETVVKKAPLSILVMDDDPSIRQVLELFFTQKNCETVMTASGEEAIDALNCAFKEGKTFTAAILDVIIPDGKGAREIIGETNRLFPGIVSIAVSGNAHDPVLGNPQAYGFTYAFQKPFSLERILKVITDAAPAGTTNR
jgi:CheY-like chemotaxis protein